MPRPPKVTREILKPMIQARGPVSATELAALLGVDRVTVGRVLRGFGEELVSLGATRSTRYLLRRQVRHLGCRWALYRIDGSGRAKQWAVLESFHSAGWRVDWADDAPAWESRFTDRNGLWSGLPFFIQDVRPQGFLGRIIARQHEHTLALPANPKHWDDDDALAYLSAAGDDIPGDLVIGEKCLRKALADILDETGDAAVAIADREASYLRLAEGIARSQPGSSAGGEQPKFLTTLLDADNARRKVLVKFSPPENEGAGRRWADLLRCESHAHEVLAASGHSQEGTRLVVGGERLFLEVPRFDRPGEFGRRGVVTLESLAASAIGHLPADWTAAAARLLELGFVHKDDVREIMVRQAFGDLIGNTDMHLGNLAFFMDDDLPFRLAPSYDMLPMMWAPGPQGELVERPFRPPPPLPEEIGIWEEATGLALDFWHRVKSETALSPELQCAAQEAEAVVRRQHARMIPASS